MSERETIARIIDPEAWKWHDRGKYPERYDADRKASLQKADDILSAINAP